MQPMLRSQQSLVLLTLLLSALVSSATSPDSWNDGFDPRLVTHQRNDANRTSRPDDVTVLVPRPGAGRFVGLLTPVTNWSGQLTGSSVDHVSAFLGVPFAAKPSGNLRFRLPRPAYLDSRGVWVARNYGNACLQGVHRFRLEQLKLSSDQFSEDCLYLNLFIPGNASEKRQEGLPVLVNIHGGTLLVSGTHAYPGHILAAKGIVMATLAYRLNIFGLISSSNHAVPGNLALWDQRAALVWIRDNVGFFGGDPNRVTLSGESAGGSSVGLHIVSNEPLLDGGKPLFHQAILMSGADIAIWALSRPEIGDHLGSVHFMAKALHCPKASRSAIVNCIRRKPAKEIDTWSLEQRPEAVEPEWLWAPVVDGVLIDDIPLVKRLTGDYMRMPIMGGCTRDDTVRSSFHFSGNVRRDLRNELTKSGSKKIADIESIIDGVIKLYLGNKAVTSPAEFNRLMENVTRDYEMIEPVYQVLKYHSITQLKNQPVFLYEFGYEKSTNRVKHGDDLDYILGVPFVTPDWWQRVSETANLPHFAQFNTDEQRRLSDFMMALWTNFVKFKDPTPTPVNGFTWQRMAESSNDSGGKCALLSLPEKSRMEVDYKGDEMRLWKRFYDAELQYVLQLNQQPQSCKPSTGLLVALSLTTAVTSVLLIAPV